MINLATMVQDVTNVRNCESKLLDSDGHFLEGSIPEATHSVLIMRLNWIVICDAVRDVGHSVEVKSTDEEALDQVGNLVHSVIIVGHGDSSHKRSCKCLVHS